MDRDKVAGLIRQLLVEIGEDPDREGLRSTPDRTARAWEEMTSGYTRRAEDVVGGAIFESEANNMIIARDIEIYSLCEHHLLPFFGRAHIGYIAKHKLLGVSKLARICEMYARRVQIQERLTAQIAEDVMSMLDAEGVGVVVECRHLCMLMRGVGQQNSVMTTSSVLGSFRKYQRTRSEFFSLIGREIPS